MNHACSPWPRTSPASGERRRSARSTRRSWSPRDDAIIAKNLDGVISAWNAAAERMFGYTEHEVIGQSIATIIPPDLRDEERGLVSRLRAGERIERYETIRLTKAGERIDVSLTISPLRDPAGRIVGCSKIARDITEAKQAEAALRQSEQRLAREVAGAKTLQSISTRLISESTPEVLVCADSRRGDGIDGVRFCQRPDARSRPRVTEAARVEEFPPGLCGILGMGRGWDGEHLQQGAQ